MASLQAILIILIVIVNANIGGSASVVGGIKDGNAVKGSPKALKWALESLGLNQSGKLKENKSHQKDGVT